MESELSERAVPKKKDATEKMAKTAPKRKSDLEPEKEKKTKRQRSSKEETDGKMASFPVENSLSQVDEAHEISDEEAEDSDDEAEIGENENEDEEEVNDISLRSFTPLNSLELPICPRLEWASHCQHSCMRGCPTHLHSACACPDTEFTELACCGCGLVLPQNQSCLSGKIACKSHPDYFLHWCDQCRL